MEQARRLKDLERENARLKKLVAGQAGRHADKNKPIYLWTPTATFSTIKEQNAAALQWYGRNGYQKVTMRVVDEDNHRKTIDSLVEKRLAQGP